VPDPAAVRTFGWREVLTVGGVIVVAVLGLSLITSILPSGAQWFVFQSPLFIVVIVIGTILVLASLLRRPPAR
jgi:Na+/melibiose symporter-like transporter